jgi:hypothetical protein
MKELQKIKDPKIPDVYLGGTYTGSPSGTWSITVKDYIKEGLRQIEGSMHIIVREEKPLTCNNDHPEEDNFPILNNEEDRQYPSVMEMLQWVVPLCRVDVCYAMSSLSRFCSCLRGVICQGP